MRLFMQNLSMRWRILLVTACIFLGFFISHVFSFWYALVNYFDKDMKQSTEKVVENIMEDIDDFSSQMKEILSVIYMDSDFMEKLNRKDFDYTDKQYAHELVKSSTMMSEIQALYIYDMEHNLVCSYRRNTSLKSPFPYDLYGTDGDEERLQQCIDNEKTECAVMGYQNYENSKGTIRYILHIYQDKGKREVGYFVCDVSDKDILHKVERTLYKDGQYVWLETENGYPVMLMDAKNQETLELIQSYQEQEENYYELLSQKSKYGYQIHILSSTSFFMANAKEFLVNMSGIILLLLLIWVCVLGVTSKKMTQELTKMTQGIEQIKNGNMNIRFQNLHHDELGKLGEQFNHMMDEIENYIYNEYKSRLILNDAKYYALQAQINPHFLFNTLSTMAGIAGAEQCDTVKNMCETLSEIFRYNIEGNMDKKFVTLEEEMTHIKNYMYIVEMRAMSGIKFYDQIPEELRNIMIPKLSIQPLVENSVNHGLKNKRGEKYICVGAEKKENEIYVRVIDNGIGMDSSKQEKYLCEEVGNQKKHTSIGLYNINERIHFLFGKEYGLSFSSVKETEVVLHIPCIRRDEHVSDVDR